MSGWIKWFDLKLQLKRIKHIEQEKDMMLQGLAAVDRTREWYIKQIAIIQEKMKYLGRVGPTAVSHISHLISGEFTNLPALKW